MMAQAPQSAGRMGQQSPPGASGRSGTPLARFIVQEGAEAVLAVAEGEPPSDGRSTTPARLSRALTPLKGGRRVLTLMSSRRWGAEEAEEEEGGQRTERKGKRKLRRWHNDRLIGVPSLAPGETLATALPLEWRSKFEELMEDENADVRDRFLSGYAGHTHRPRSSSRTATPFEEAHSRFIQMEKRVRQVLVEAVTSERLSLRPFLEAVDDLLRGFIQGEPLPELNELPLALRRALQAQPEVRGPGDSLLSLQLRPSAFSRLLVHGLSQFYGLRSRSEDVGDSRAVMVSKPRELHGAVMLGPSLLGMRLVTYVQASRARSAARERGGRRLGRAEEPDDGLDLVML